MALPALDSIIAVRRWDERAKQEGLSTPSFEYDAALLATLIEQADA